MDETHATQFSILLVFIIISHWRLPYYPECQFVGDFFLAVMQLDSVQFSYGHCVSGSDVTVKVID